MMNPAAVRTNRSTPGKNRFTKEKLMNRIKNRTLFAVAGCLLTVFWMVPATFAAMKAPAGQIAQVNKTAIMRQDLEREMKLVAMKLTRQGKPVDVDQLKPYEGKIRETLINRTLLLQKSQAMGIKVKDSLVKKALDEFKAVFPNEKDYKQTLKNMGYTEEALKKQIKDGLAIKTLLDKEVLRKIAVSDKQTRSFYDAHPDLFRQPEQVKASHILIKVPKNASDAQKAAAMAKIKALKERIDKGENFASLAMEYSEGPSKTKGGDLGFFTHDQMVKPFADAAFALQPGQVSDVVTTRFGYHLIRVTDRKAAHTMAFNDVKDAISKRLHQQQEGKEISAYLEKLKEHAEIKRFPM
jgi:peptidyl-prolyl cis-trans isomerase C